MLPDDAVAQPAAADYGAHTDADVGPDVRILDPGAGCHAYGRLDVARRRIVRQTRPAGQKDLPVRIEQRLELAAVPPVPHFGGQDPVAVIDHVLEGVREEVLAELRGLPHHVMDALEQQLPVADVVQPDVGQARDGLGWLLHDRRHAAVVVGEDHAKPLVVLDFLRPDDAIDVFALAYQSEIGVEQGIHEHDQDRPAHVRFGEANRIGGPELLDLLHAREPEIGALSGQPLLDSTRQVAHDSDDLVDARFVENVEHVRENRPVPDLQERLRNGVRLWAKAGSLAGQRQNGLHT